MKPANVIVDQAGNAKLTDFGIARAARDSGRPRELVGTARYIAPERIEGRPVTARTDVYGLALVAYELLAGQPAFAGAENEDLLRDRLQRGAPHPRDVQPSIAENVDLVVAKGLAREPEGRYPTAGAFAQALSDAADDETTQVLHPVVAPARRRRPRPDALLALGLVLVLLLGVVLFFARFPASAAPAPSAGASAAPSGVPRVIGLKLEAAITSLQAAGFNVRWDVSPAQGPSCDVVSQDPAAGTLAARGIYVSVVYVAGKDCTKKGG